VGGEAVGRLGDAVRMHLHDVRRFGPDARLTYSLEHGPSPDPLAHVREPVKKV
jgi:hypothetical protein